MSSSRILLLAFALTSSGCADRELGGGGDSASDDEEFVPPSPRFDVFDYGRCSLGAVVPDCEGLDCAEDGTEPLYELFEATAAVHWIADYVDVSRTYVQPVQGTAWVDFQVHAGWARSGHSLELPTDNEDERREIIWAALDAIDVPLTLADPQTVSAAVTECLGVELEPCHDLVSPGLVSKIGPSSEGGLANWIVHVNTKTGSTEYCGPDD